MLIATSIGIFFIPLFFAAIEGFATRKANRHTEHVVAAAPTRPELG